MKWRNVRVHISAVASTRQADLPPSVGGQTLCLKGWRNTSLAHGWLQKQIATKMTWFHCAQELLFFFWLWNSRQNLPEMHRGTLRVMNHDIQLKCIFYSQHQKAELALANKLQPISFSNTRRSVPLGSCPLQISTAARQGQEEQEDEPSIPCKTRWWNCNKSSHSLTPESASL